jgi:hypothetical protein
LVKDMHMIEIEREDLETLLQLAFENWQMAESEWSNYPDADDLAFLLKMSKLSGNETFIKDANDKLDSALRGAEADAAMARTLIRQSLERKESEDAKLSEYMAKATDHLEKIRAITSPTPSAAGRDAP